MNFGVPVVRTKIIIPRRRTEILSRPRLLSILENVLDLKLLILAAPAGYGKTSLLIDFAYHTQLPVCWFAIDSLDVDPKRFIAHFIAAIANCFPSFGEASSAALSNLDENTQNLEPVISAIINDAYDNISEHFVFVLDDYHLVRECKLIDEFINRISLEISENCHFVIASRTLLTLPDLTLMVARSQVGGLSYEELAFLPEEIKQLYSVNYHQNISEEAASDLVDQTEGWITGLLLSAQLNPQETTNRLRLARVSGIGLYEYLAQQVLEQQPEGLILFLKRTSLLEEFDANLCEKIFSQVEGIEKDNWHEKIDLLLKENLFVLPVDDETLHLRYHHLFRDFLQNCMRVERAEETASIESHLADYYEETKEWERAFAIYSRQGNPEETAGLILRSAPSMILSGRLAVLSSWIDQLPEPISFERPEFLSIRGAIAMMKGESKNSLSIMNKAIDGLRKNKNTVELIATLIRRSWVNRFFGKYDLAKADAEEAITMSDGQPDFRKLNAEAYRAIGLSYFQSGELKNSLNALTISLDMFYQLDEAVDAAKVLLDLGPVYSSLGQQDEADAAYHKSLAYWQQTQNSLWQTNLLNNIGVIQHLSGKYEQAALSFEKAILHARLAINPRLEGFSLTSLGDLFRDIRALPEARRAYQLAREATKTVNDQALQIFLELSEANLERLTSNDAGHEAHMKNALAIAEMGGSKYEINLCKLVNSVSLLVKKRFSEVDGTLRELDEYFTKEGFHLEELRVKYYLAIVQMFLQPTVTNEEKLGELIYNNLNDRDKPAFIQIGFETLELLESYVKKRGKTESLVSFITALKKFENSLGPLRKVIRRHSEAVQFTVPKLVIRAFGKCQVKIGERLVALSDWKTQIVRDFFFFILAHPDGVTKEEIGEAFWPDSTIDTLRVRFKNSIYRLRHALGSETITFIEDYYRFNRTLEFEYDVESFLHELQMVQSSECAEDKIQHLRQAVGYYHGSYLPKMDYEWVIVQREQYHRQFLNQSYRFVVADQAI